MSGARITIDGLWRCLCPSIDAVTFTRAVSTPHPYRPRLSPHRNRRTRPLHTTPRRLQDRLVQPNEKATKDPLPSAEWETWEDLAHSSQKEKPAATAPPPSSAKTVDPENVRRILKVKDAHDVPADVTNEEILEALRFTRDLQRPNWRTLTTILVRHLLAKGVPPNTFIYETLLLAHAHPEGSAKVVDSLLSEMRENKIPWSSTTYHNALRALAVHPDYLLRADILRQMKERWIEVTPQGHQYIALGLLRDEQYEMALEKLEHMTNQGDKVEPWVFDIFVYVFGTLEFFDDALQMVRHRLDAGHHVSVNIWYFLLDVCSRGKHYEATTYLWARTVAPRLVNPSDGVCLQVLNMAASYGDADLATDVLQFLASRGTKLGQAHYEAVADAYCTQGNVEKAMETFCIMHAARVETTSWSMGALSQALAHHPAQIDAIVPMLEKLKEKYKIPLVVFNTILNQIVKTELPDQPDTYGRALRFYHRIREFCYEGPNWETFRHLLWKCTDPQLAQVVAGEMSWFGIRHNKTTSELMFQVQVNHQGPSYRAKRYFYMVEPHYRKASETAPVVKSTQWRRFMDLSVKFVRRLIGERDPEAWRILAHCQKNGLEEDVVKALREDVESGRIVMQPQEEGTNQEGDGKKEDERDVF